MIQRTQWPKKPIHNGSMMDSAGYLREKNYLALIFWPGRTGPTSLWLVTDVDASTIKHIVVEGAGRLWR